jgi:hypothetical protein
MQNTRKRAPGPLDQEVEQHSKASFDEAVAGTGSWDEPVSYFTTKTHLSGETLRWLYRNHRIRGKRIGVGKRGRLVLDVMSVTDYIRTHPPTKTKRPGRRKQTAQEGETNG